MPKGFQNRLCVFCSIRQSTPTGDHVFARHFFTEEQRANLPKVPACVECNGEKSRLEHHLTSVLPFGGIHADAHQALNAAGHRLTRNARLHRELAQGAGGGTLPFRPEILTNFIALAVRGLLFYHWDVRLGPEHGVKVIYPTQAAEEAFELYVRGNPKRRVDENLGNGTFRYVGLQVPDYDQLSLWKMWIYGGVRLSGDHTDETESSTAIIVLTGTQEFLARPAVAAIFG